MSEQDTREKLEADVKEWCATYPTWNHANEFREHVFEWLDRQAAITSSEWCWSNDALEEELTRKEAEVAELTAECDKLQKHKRRATMKVMRLEQEREQLDRRMAELAGKYQERLQQIAKLTAEHDELQAAIDAMENGQFYAMYEELRAEVDNLRKRNDNQADTIKRLRAEFDVALDDLVRAVDDKRSHPF